MKNFIVEIFHGQYRVELLQFCSEIAPHFISRKNVSRNDLCVDLIPYWHIAVDRIADGKVDIDTTVSLIRSCCKLQRCGSADTSK
jgi:hypothetical protein